MFGKLTRKDETNGSLNFARCDGLAFVGAGEVSGFNGDSFKNVIHEGIHNVHGFLGDSDVVVNLLEYLVDEGSIRIVISLAMRAGGLFGGGWSSPLLDGGLLGRRFSGGLSGGVLFGAR